MSVSYLVCATPRSGSTLLCETLRTTGVAGNPLEFFEARPETGVPRGPLDYLAGLDDAEALALVAGAPPPEAPPYSDLRGCEDYDEHLARVRAAGTTPNGVFGAKIMWAHLVDLGRQLGSDDLAALVDERFDRPRFVWVRRRDAVRQAVSLWRALQTQSWRAENEPAAGEPQYSYAALRHLVELLTTNDSAWEQFLAGRDHVLTLTYEEIASDIGDAVARTLAHIGVTLPRLDALPTLRRQADERSAEWAEAYARDAVAATR
ncbi:MAG TPA: Stf0 family sulfotransferase [Solirubrobacteraceae bacterium]|nr:Stf0 family sulfotransferase [Solirubrobacteraceae bacterium]